VSRQAKVGGLFLAFFAMLLFLSPSLSQRSTVLGNSYTLLFDEVNGLREGDGLKFSGVSAGRIARIDFSTNSQKQEFGAEAQVAVLVVTDFGVQIPEDSRASVEGTIGGMRWVEVTPGKSSRFLRPGAVARLRLKPSQTNELEASLAGLQEMNQRTVTLRASLEDPAFRRRIKDLASNARFYSTELEGLSRQAQARVAGMNRQLDERQKAILGQLDRISAQVDQARRRTEELVPRLNEEAHAWESRMEASGPRIQAMIDRADRETRRFREMAEQAEERVHSAGLDESVREKLSRMAQRTEEMATMAEDLHMVSSNPETQAELREMVARSRRQAEELRRNLERWERSIP
jgi:ABC-type transporter Mla subunit MlaD